MKRWIKKPPADPQKTTSLSKEINIHPVLASILIQRGIETFEQARIFFRPNVRDLHDPFMMKDMDLAVMRILKAIQSHQKILIYGDYDVDGTTSVAMVHSFFCREIGYQHVAYYIPDRYKEGYGISQAGIQFAIDNEFSLVIALDCGIKSVELISKAKTEGVDFIVCDHHLPDSVLPPASAILNPKQPECPYPYKELCGCGVGFKLLQALSQKIGLPAQDVFGYLDMVAIATCCDIVQLTGENRILVAEGLKTLNAQTRPGIRQLMEMAGVKKYFEVEDVVFFIGPRINAAGRIKHGSGAVELLTASAFDPLIKEYARLLQESNTERQALDKSITAEALHMIESDPVLIQKKTTVLYQPSWHKGVVGIVASRVSEKYYRPTIILTQSNDLITGSARSIKGFDVYAAIDQCADLLVNYGGHMYAAGLTLRKENLQAFQDKFETIVANILHNKDAVPEIEIDAELPIEQISPSFYKILRQMAPFGPGNMDPVFEAQHILALEGTRVVGETHLKLVITNQTKKVIYKGIAFKQAHQLTPITNNPFSMAYNLRENEWNGQTSLELDVKDIQLTNRQLD